MILADGVTIQIGQNIWMLGFDTIMYALIVVIVGLVAEFIVGWHIPFGFVGAFIAAFVGIWLMTRVIVVSGMADINVYGVPLIRALLGAIVFVAIWHFFTFGVTRRYRPREA